MAAWRFAFALIGLCLAPQLLARESGLPPVGQAVFFGDSLTDAGTYGFRFTTNPGLTWAQWVALHYGQPPLPNEHVDNYADVYVGKAAKSGPAGLNYAQGGARSNNPYSSVSQSSQGAPISAMVQVGRYLAQHYRFTDNQLIALYVGTNDVAFNFDPANDPALSATLRENREPSAEQLVQERARVAQAAADTAATVRRIIAHGGKRILVFKLLDMGNLPLFQTRAAQRFMTAQSRFYNEELVKNLPDDPALLLIDVQDFVDEVSKDRKSLGLSHLAHEDACRLPNQDFCYAGALKSEHADRTYLFAGGEHMTTRGNELLARYVLRKLNESHLR